MHTQRQTCTEHSWAAKKPSVLPQYSTQCVRTVCVSLCACIRVHASKIEIYSPNRVCLYDGETHLHKPGLTCMLTNICRHPPPHTHTFTQRLMRKHWLSPAAIGYIAMHTKKTRIEEGQSANREMDETSRGGRGEGWMGERGEADDGGLQSRGDL